MIRRFGPSLALVAVAAVALVLAAASPAQNGPALRFGFADDAAMQAFPASARIAEAAGFSYARVYISWADVARARPANPRDPNDPAYDWSEVDADLAPYAHTGLQLMGQLWHTPAWANGGQPQTVYPQNPQDLGDFAYAAALRYPQIRWWIPVNEANARLYADPATAAAYEPLLRAVYASVKQARPDDMVAGGSLIRNLGNPERDAWAFARKLAADGAPMDAFAVDPYPGWSDPISVRSADRLDI